MAITWVSESASSGVAGGDVTVTKPVGLAVGDLMIGIGVTTAAQTITPPGNWTVHPNSLSTARPLFYRVADAADVAAASFLFVTSGAATGIVVIAAYRGVDPVTPMAGTAGVVSTASTTLTIAAANPSVAATLAQLVVKLNLATWTPPGTVSPERWDHTISGVGSTAGGHETVGAGSTGTRAWVASAGAAAGLGYAVPIREASQTVTVAGFDLAVSFGTPVLKPVVAPAGFDLAVSFGTPTLVPDQLVSPTGLALVVGFGSPTLVLDQFVTPTGVTFPITFGGPALVREVTPTGFDLTVLFGTPTLVPDRQVTVAGFDLPISFGTATVTPISTLLVVGFDLPVSFGTPTLVGDGFLPVTGFNLTVQFGTATPLRQPFVTATVYDHETGLPVGAGAVVQLFDADGTLLDETTTDATGVYLFHLAQGFTDDVFTVVRVTIDGTDYQGVSDICAVQS